MGQTIRTQVYEVKGKTKSIKYDIYIQRERDSCKLFCDNYLVICIVQMSFVEDFYVGKVKRVSCQSKLQQGNHSFLGKLYMRLLHLSFYRWALLLQHYPYMHVISAQNLKNFASQIVVNHATCIAGESSCFSRPKKALTTLVEKPI